MVEKTGSSNRKVVKGKQIAAGMVISFKGKIYRVDGCNKVSSKTTGGLVKTTLRDLGSDKVVNKHFRMDQDVEEATLSEGRMEFLYVEGTNCVFLDVDKLILVGVPSVLVGGKAYYLKEGTEVKAFTHDGSVFWIELPQFLELMVVTVVDQDLGLNDKGVQYVILETGAKIETPNFIEVGDIIKVDPENEEYIQRI